MLNNQASLNDQFNQWLVGRRDHRRVWLSSTTTRSATPAARRRRLVPVVVRRRRDLVPAVKVTTAQTDETTGGQDTGNQYGDYNGLSGIAGDFFPSWTDRRSGAEGRDLDGEGHRSGLHFPGAPTIGTATATAPTRSR